MRCVAAAAGYMCIKIAQWMKLDETNNIPSKVAHLPDDYQAKKAGVADVVPKQSSV